MPNITGHFLAYDWGKSDGVGAFRAEIDVKNQLASGSASEYNHLRFKFDASRSSSIYGKSTTVTPENMSVLYCIKY